MTSTSLQFLGAVGTVTGSRFLIERGSASVLIDAGLYQGHKELRLRNWEIPSSLDVERLDAVVLTHAHVDHCGYLPKLYAAGFRGDIYATSQTIALANIVLPDAGRLQEEDARHANKHQWSKHHPALPLFTEKDAMDVAELFRAVPFDRSFEVAGGLTARLQSAGHVLGAASVLITDLLGRRIVFSGDLGRPSHPLLEAPACRPECDVLVLESTYGDRTHTDEGLDRFATLIRETVALGGVVVIPTFAVDRTEILLHAIQMLERSGVIPAVPVIVDSPMALAVLDVYRNALRNHDPQLRPELFVGGDPFTTAHLVEAHSVEESKDAVARTDPRIIISASGMATGGRVLHHLAKHLPNPHNTVILPGFQAAGTRGRQLVDGIDQIKIHGAYIPVRARVAAIDVFSAHADANDLVHWAIGGSDPDTTFLVHGEPGASAALKRTLAARRWNTVVPRLEERVLI
jgi:metallo-beta-lactamase family protein